MSIPQFKCRCPHCGHEWVYHPRYGIPLKQVTCPKCHKTITLLKCCKPVQSQQT